MYDTVSPEIVQYTYTTKKQPLFGAPSMFAKSRVGQALRPTSSRPGAFSSLVSQSFPAPRQTFRTRAPNSPPQTSTRMGRVQPKTQAKGSLTNSPTSYPAGWRGPAKYGLSKVATKNTVF